MISSTIAIYIASQQHNISQNSLAQYSFVTKWHKTKIPLKLTLQLQTIPTNSLARYSFVIK
jgi:hypothetical protein